MFDTIITSTLESSAMMIIYGIFEQDIETRYWDISHALIIINTSYHYIGECYTRNEEIFMIITRSRQSRRGKEMLIIE